MVEGKKLWLVIKPYMRCPLLPPNFEFCFNCLCHGNLYLLLAKPKWREIAMKCGGQVQQEQYATKNLQQLLLNCHIVQLLTTAFVHIGSCSFMFAFNDKQNFFGARQNTCTHSSEIQMKTLNKFSIKRLLGQAKKLS